MDIAPEAKERLLSIPSEADTEPDVCDWNHDKTILRRRLYQRFGIIQIVLLLIYAVVFETLHYGDTSGRDIVRLENDFVYTPAEPVNSFEKVELNMHLYKDNPYKGPPSPEVDAAWDKLFTNSFIRLSEEELSKLGRTSVSIPDGSGDYLGALDVYHQLHCVRFVFQYVNQDYYTLRKINVPALDHINHCVDVLRQVVMCLSDTSISTSHFRPDYSRTWPEFKFQHSCRNWDAVNSWAGMPGRAVDQSDPEKLESWLQNPDYVNTGHDFDGHGEDD